MKNAAKWLLVVVLVLFLDETLDNMFLFLYMNDNILSQVTRVGILLMMVKSLGVFDSDKKAQSAKVESEAQSGA